VINTFITPELARLEQLTSQQEKQTTSIEELNRLFREMVEGR